MAQNAVGRLFRSQNSTTLRQSIGSLTQTRNASRNAIPTFQQTSSPELDQALTRFREELFIPFGLGQDQRRLMFRQKYADRLEQEPVTANISEDEDFLLRPMDPQSRPTLKEAAEVISLMQSKEDWKNLVPFLSGLQLAKRHLKPSRLEWLVRKAGEHNALNSVVECAKQAEKTGVRLNEVGIVQRLFFELHRKAQKAEFQGQEVTKAFNMATQLVGLMERPAHAQHDVMADPKRKPFVAGTLLELSAARALSEFEGKDQGGLVRIYSSRVLGCWKMGNFASDVQDWRAVDKMLQENVPIYNGMKLALKVQGIANEKAVAPGLKNRLNELGQLIAKQKKSAPQEIQKNPSLGLEQAQLLHED
ncbi:hypothetical protein AbraIFM66951_010187 [Aspergillus brasiliensis]|uniref:Uncharacterized protein n=2 Tax=Aspergillus brasiliensis TaxID=319629 RepID=A0A1L9ULH5_ASPBC|nr:hypothetical protein ASPBRDRAFT_124002 [Aspergillus brasiliensis CBS 101740]GKZ20988.1 hypothetical protein AbraCBS73388_006626 [Aspergillus brasiliensis]GKZ47012.1 hypothetical protein AbraIFM66951_010187 [Aspergillus brasiliensis]